MICFITSDDAQKSAMRHSKYRMRRWIGEVAVDASNGCKTASFCQEWKALDRIKTGSFSKEWILYNPKNILKKICNKKKIYIYHCRPTKTNIEEGYVGINNKTYAAYLQME